MPASTSALSVRQARFLAALLTHDSIKAAAHTASINETTAHDWLKFPHFQAEYARARQRIVRNALAQVQRHTEAAAQTLKALLEDDSSTTRVYAAKTILDLALRAITFDNHEQRLQALEEEQHASTTRHAS